MTKLQFTTKKAKHHAKTTSYSLWKSTKIADLHLTVTRVVHGRTVLANQFTTITLSASTVTSMTINSKKVPPLSKHNRNIVIGCCVGIGLPVLIVAMALIHLFCLRSRKTDFIDSDGQIVTAYSDTNVVKGFKELLGKTSEPTFETHGQVNTDDDSYSNGDDDSHNEKSEESPDLEKTLQFYPKEYDTEKMDISGYINGHGSFVSTYDTTTTSGSNESTDESYMYSEILKSYNDSDSIEYCEPLRKLSVTNR